MKTSPFAQFLCQAKIEHFQKGSKEEEERMLFTSSFFAKFWSLNIEI